jgi:hypothetical protein
LSSGKAGRNQKQNLTQQNPSRAQQKSKPGTAKTKSGATKYKYLFLPPNEAFQ